MTPRVSHPASGTRPWKQFSAGPNMAATLKLELPAAGWLRVPKRPGGSWADLLPGGIVAYATSLTCLAGMHVPSKSRLRQF